MAEAAPPPPPRLSPGLAIFKKLKFSQSVMLRGNLVKLRKILRWRNSL